LQKIAKQTQTDKTSLFPKSVLQNSPHPRYLIYKPIHKMPDLIVKETDCQRFVAGRWITPGTPVTSTNKTDRHDISEILLKVALNTINQT